jgi:phosphatidylinositol alpha-mannosyltransferase
VVGDGPLRSYYQSLAAGDADVVFTGAVASAERPGYYAHADVYAAPTLGRASFGITLLEAMACGTPIVASDIAGFRCVVAHEREALLTPRDDAAAFAGALARLLDDDALRARMGHVGRERALAFGWHRVTEQVLGVYARVAERARMAA